MRLIGLGRLCWATVAVLYLSGTSASAQFGGGNSKKKEADSKQESDLGKFRDEAADVLAPLAQGAGAPEISKEQWTIVIVAFSGKDQEMHAKEGLARIATEAGITGAYLEKRDQATVIAYGGYPAPDDRTAQADLERIKGMTVNGKQPFAAALLTPPSPEHLAGSLPELDLRNAKKLFGKDKALYTLQVALYGRPDRTPASREEIAEFRKAAEQAAVLLRRDGELAFYYHAPERSMVTVGVFGEEDYDPLHRPGIEGWELQQARDAHPLNLVNGQGLRERIPGVQGTGPEAFRLQPSQLVGVPDS
ncbi:MAG: hypothetical protein IPJ41_18300 [Phycisphaerales bacterium]|nr:hypothetical protein [Phycisphaerales bacterium]